MRTFIVFLGLVAALATSAGAASAASAAAPPRVLCGASCDGGYPGYTGCTQVTASQSDGIPLLGWYKHYLVVNYCKRNGMITSTSIAAHGCDTSGVVVCSTGPAWQTSGGVGYGFVTFTGHATWIGALAGIPVMSTSIVNLSVPVG